MAFVRVLDSGPGVDDELAERPSSPSSPRSRGRLRSWAVDLCRHRHPHGRLARARGGPDAPASVCARPLQMGPRMPPTHGARPRAGCAQRVLLVDESGILSTLAALLAPAEVTTASSMEEAKAAWSGTYDLILSDIVRPGGTDSELRDRVQQTHPEALPRFVLMTGSAVGMEEAVRGLPPEQAVLQKPWPSWPGRPPQMPSAPLWGRWIRRTMTTLHVVTAGTASSGHPPLCPVQGTSVAGRAGCPRSRRWRRPSRWPSTTGASGSPGRPGPRPDGRGRAGGPRRPG